MRFPLASILLGCLSLLVQTGQPSEGQGLRWRETWPPGFGHVPSLAEPRSRTWQHGPEKKTTRSQPAERPGEDGSGAFDSSSEVGSSSPVYTLKDSDSARFQRHRRSRSWHAIPHLRGYGSYNMDSHACAEIQLKPCQKPSDCEGCLGLYTCKPTLGKCDFKALSRKTGADFQDYHTALGGTPFFLAIQPWGLVTRCEGGFQFHLPLQVQANQQGGG